mmetsp:Transcript_37108/g.104692  ORF Transcript_37108/g.104692 Transcript_37108/m.104692 type:complete len:138 (-) Transcript_37108:897-1310(-)
MTRWLKGLADELLTGAFLAEALALGVFTTETLRTYPALGAMGLPMGWQTDDACTCGALFALHGVCGDGAGCNGATSGAPLCAASRCLGLARAAIGLATAAIRPVRLGTGEGRGSRGLKQATREPSVHLAPMLPPAWC